MEWSEKNGRGTKTNVRSKPDVRQVKTTKKAAAVNDKKFFLARKNVHNFKFFNVLWGASSELMFFDLADTVTTSELIPLLQNFLCRINFAQWMRFFVVSFSMKYISVVSSARVLGRFLLLIDEKCLWGFAAAVCHNKIAIQMTQMWAYAI